MIRLQLLYYVMSILIDLGSLPSHASPRYPRQVFACKIKLFSTFSSIALYRTLQKVVVLQSLGERERERESLRALISHGDSELRELHSTNTLNTLHLTLKLCDPSHLRYK